MVTAATALPITHSLPKTAFAAASKGMPLVVMTTLTGCPYCDVVRGHYLGPMLREGQLQAIQIDIRDNASALETFGGNSTTPAAQVKAWNANFAPTVLFLGPSGEELAERLVGMAVPDLYGAYLDTRLELATRRLKTLKITVQKK